jgi:ribonuclease P protein component
VEGRPPIGQRFPRAFSLKRRRLIRPLFARGRADVFEVSAGVVKVLCRFAPSNEVGRAVPFQAGFAPGRRARTNAGRTHLRRLMRETFRVHQQPLVDLLLDKAAPHDGSPVLTMMWLFRGREATAPSDLRRDVPRALRRLTERLADAGRPDGQAAVNPGR